MPSVNELIDALMEHYFEETNNIERYKILQKVEEAVAFMRKFTIDEIEKK